MNNEKQLLGYYNYTVILTYIGMLTGFMGIVYAFENSIFRAVVCLMAAGFCDMFDGTVASTRERTDQEKCFGIQIDSLSDLICFGVLPASIAYSMNQGSSVVLGISAMYVLCALIRLAYFNVDEEERQRKSADPRVIYYGMPVTMSAMFVPIVYGVAYFFGWKPAHGMSIALLAMAILFLLPFQVKKPKFIGKLCFLMCGVLEIFLVAMACAGE